MEYKFNNFVMHSNSSIEFNFDDDNIVFLSSCGSSYCIKESCYSSTSSVFWRQTRFVTSEFKNKIVFALKLKNMFSEYPYLPSEFLNPDYILAYPQKIDCNNDISLSCKISSNGYYILKSNPFHLLILMLPNSNFVVIHSLVELINNDNIKYEYCWLTQCFSINFLPERWSNFVDLLINFKSNFEQIPPSNFDSFKINCFDFINEELIYLNDQMISDNDASNEDLINATYNHKNFTLLKSLPHNCYSTHLHKIRDPQLDFLSNIKIYLSDRILYVIPSNKQNVDILFPDYSSMHLLENSLNVFHHVFINGHELFYSISCLPIENKNDKYSIANSIFTAIKLMQTSNKKINNLNNCLNTNFQNYSPRSNSPIDSIFHDGHYSEINYTIKNIPEAYPNVEHELLHLKCFNYILENSGNESNENVKKSEVFKKYENNANVICLDNITSNFSENNSLKLDNETVLDVLNSTNSLLTKIDQILTKGSSV